LRNFRLTLPLFRGIGRSWRELLNKVWEVDPLLCPYDILAPSLPEQVWINRPEFPEKPSKPATKLHC